MLPRNLSRVVGWANAHHLYGFELEVRGALWAFMRTCEIDAFCWVALAVTDRFSSDATHDFSVLGSVVAGVDGSASLVAVSGGSYVLADTHSKNLGIGYSQKLVEHPVFDLRLLKRCLQKISSSVFGSLDPYLMTDFILTRLKGAELRDWMMSRSSLRRAIITGELSMPSLLKVVSNIVGVWSLIVFYLKETGRKTDGDRLVVTYILLFISVSSSFSCSSSCFVLEEGNRWLFLHGKDGKKKNPPVSSNSRFL